MTMIQTRNLSHTLLLSLLALLSLTLTGCRQDRIWGDEVDPEGGDQTIELSILLPDNSGSLRSVEGGDAKAETLVKNLDIYLYKGDNLSTADSRAIKPEYHEHITVDSSAGVIHRAISHKDQGATYQLYVVANAPDNDLTGEETLSELTASVTYSTPILKGPYVMSGRSRDYIPSEAKHVDVVLSRIASKVILTDDTKDDKFELISVIPLRPDRSYLFSHTTPFEVGDQEKVDNPIVPKETEILWKQEDEVTASDRKVTLLTYESGLPKEVLPEEVLPEEVLQGVGAGMLIKAKYEDKDCWYRFALMDGRGRQIVRRNSVYSVEIKEVNGKGYATAKEAMDHRPINMILGITSTKTAIKLSEQIVTDGEYFIGSTRAIIHLGSRANKEYKVGEKEYATNRNDRQVAPVITIRSNIPESDFSEFKIQEKKYSYAGHSSHKEKSFTDPDGEDWITAELKKHTPVPGEIEIPATQDLAYDFRGLYIDDRWGGVTEEQLIEKRYTRSVEYKIGVDSHPNLFLRLTIDQTPDELLRDQLVIYPSLLSVDSKRQQTFDLFIQGYHEGFEWEVMGVTYLTGEDPKSQKWVSYSPAKGITGVDKHILVTTNPLSEGQNSGHALIKVKLTNPKGEVVDIKTIRISSGEALEYDIVYPEGSPRVEDLSRKIRVIETPLDQSGDLTYTINVRSVTPWIVQRPEKDSDWITQPERSIDPNTATAGVGFNGYFTVTVKQNKVEPLNGLYKARQSVVRIISERASRDIIVYQGGYVVIGDTKWIDRNLMRTARKDMVDYTPKGYYYMPDGYNGTRIVDLLYPAAVPIAFGENMFACYAKHRAGAMKLSYGATSTALPFVYHNYGDDYKDFFAYVSKGGKPSPQNDGYFGGCMPATLMALSYFDDDYSAPENAWNAKAEMDNSKERDPLKEPTKKGAYDPCPEGWRTAAYREVNELVQHMAREPHFYSAGLEDTAINSDDPDATRAYGQDYKAPYNNGVYFINEDNVNVWFPYAGYRQASNDEADVEGSKFSQLMKPGYEGRYWFNFFYGDGNSIFLSIKTTADGSLKAALIQDNAFFGGSVRCVEDKELK